MSKKMKSVFGKMSESTFLAKYWQKKPLLIRKALFPFPEYITAEELAGLSCEPHVMSRIILERGGKEPWQVKRGPFNSKTYRSLPKDRWTLLVNGVDRYVPVVNTLLDSFRFVPNWRIDDIMISYAADKGGVGAHVDNYDVFLIQAAGRREWQIHTSPVYEEDYIPNRAVRQLRHFKPNKTWVLEAGDMLYLPPRVPHNGIARGTGCMTYSIGFRAPSHAELIDDALSFAMSNVHPEERYVDPELRLGEPGEISSAALKKVQSILSRGALNKSDLCEWFGCYVTSPKDEEMEQWSDVELSAADVKDYLRRGLALIRGEGVRLAFIRSGSSVMFFANGRMYDFGKDAKLAKLLSSGVRIQSRALTELKLQKSQLGMIAILVNEGMLYFDI